MSVSVYFRSFSLLSLLLSTARHVPHNVVNYFCSKVMFALQVGSLQQLPSCNVQLDGDRSDGKVLLQYSRNKV